MIDVVPIGLYAAFATLSKPALFIIAVHHSTLSASPFVGRCDSSLSLAATFPCGYRTHSPTRSPFCLLVEMSALNFYRF